MLVNNLISGTRRANLPYEDIRGLWWNKMSSPTVLQCVDDDNVAEIVVDNSNHSYVKRIHRAHANLEERNIPGYESRSKLVWRRCKSV